MIVCSFFFFSPSDRASYSSPWHSSVVVPFFSRIRCCSFVNETPPFCLPWFFSGLTSFSFHWQRGCHPSTVLSFLFKRVHVPLLWRSPPLLSSISRVFMISRIFPQTFFTPEYDFFSSSLLSRGIGRTLYEGLFVSNSQVPQGEECLSWFPLHSRSSEESKARSRPSPPPFHSSRWSACHLVVISISVISIELSFHDPTWHTLVDELCPFFKLTPWMRDDLHSLFQNPPLS